jgi:EAL domain-containing protein (putative c-di-GMP-specific phosphodiesterase class I)
MSETGLEPSLLMLEATERVLLEDLTQSTDALNRLKALGANLAVDDCRSGQESLGYLRQLPVDTLKIDRSFVMNLGKQRERSQVESIIHTGTSLKLELVAEGIEEAGQATDLLSMGCELGQGFYFSKPLAGPQMFDYLDQQWRQKAA